MSVPSSFEDAEPIDVTDLAAEVPSAEGISFFQRASDQGWRISQRRKDGLRLWCPCPEQGKTHQTWIVPAPTSGSYFYETRQRLERTTCWEET